MRLSCAKCPIRSSGLALSSASIILSSNAYGLLLPVPNFGHESIRQVHGVRLGRGTMRERRRMPVSFCWHDGVETNAKAAGMWKAVNMSALISLCFPRSYSRACSVRVDITPECTLVVLFVVVVVVYSKVHNCVGLSRDFV